ncbi:MAG TPA: hypothetical protein VGX25_20870 [Actinophytocola sp.]|uniref:hypothetical protein n=1 Tax=Actinophytocola sp. TaxID=1872138 RepID=UPI002DDCD325|nr:hypothetical protein [Actinophytocola sp.]HEV2781847.1 hypothetical protein [Actinophytocola sp.]
MRHLAAVLGAGLLLVLGTACGGQSGRNEPGAAPPSLPISTTPTTLVPVGQLDDSALPEGYPREAWVDGRTIAVKAQEGGCGKASLEVGEQGPDQVKITLVETQPPGQPVCTMDIRYPILTATLDDPLDGRTIVLRAEQRTA